MIPVIYFFDLRGVEEDFDEKGLLLIAEVFDAPDLLDVTETPLLLETYDPVPLLFEAAER